MQTPKHDPNWVIVGKIGRTHGIKGELLFKAFAEDIESFEEFYIYDKSWNKFELEFVGKSKIKAKGYEDPESAKFLTNKYISVPRSHMPELKDEEFYWHDLIGLTVINLQEQNLGIIQEISEYGAHPNIMTDGPRKYIIPLINNIIIKKDFKNGTITVDWHIDD